MPFWKRSKPEFEPESLRLQSDQVEATAAEAVEGFLNMIRAEGYDLAGIQELEGGRAFERGLTTLTNLGGSEYYKENAQKLMGAGVRDPRYYAVLAENANEVNSLILQKLAALGCDVARLEESVKERQ